MMIWMLLGAGIIFGTDKLDLHLWINQLNHPLTDTIFRYLTHLGDGIFAGLIVLIIFFYKIRYAVIGLVGVFGSGIFSQLLKRLIYDDHYRPSKVFESLADLHFVDGVILYSRHSFPSGHATTAFALFLFLAFLAPYKWVRAVCFGLAIVTAFSRVYISQHFFEDIYVGSLIGFTFMYAAIIFINSKNWGDRGLLSQFDSKK
ncbi:MAG: phosphatase PAP2 family protein [Flavobacteriales bacterium]|nr:phosphatase PAP2 family protein [Flavobacteriales bacterium]NCG30094.1 phosphatase PAP2 family protein [Bacteroidota bacterium]MBT3964276.1 phosphatase PAP2 family protein [Flavobacteriales bacterium]MBT4705590.1 phosphatase PAP2 family protein [Flavobacteriales bacterium]MBT4931129.1 phosphatase PAP2 family protein [Flavobacteriales bacterium]